MKHKNFKIKIFSAVSLFFLFLIFGSASASASLEFLISWQSGNYVPQWYLGKSLPIAGSPIKINFELIDNGKPVNLSKNIIRWYVNGDLAKNESDGLGIKSLMVSVPKNSQGKMTVRISIIDYDADSVLEKMIVIPVSKPEAVINSPYVGNKIVAGLSVFKLTPFFFNVNDLRELTVKWSANGANSKPYEDNSWRLDLSINNQAAEGFKINLGATVINSSNQLESANSAIMLQKK
jgi:hypothetical protein